MTTIPRRAYAYVGAPNSSRGGQEGPNAGHGGRSDYPERGSQPPHQSNENRIAWRVHVSEEDDQGENQSTTIPNTHLKPLQQSPRNRWHDNHTQCIPKPPLIHAFSEDYQTLIKSLNLHLKTPPQFKSLTDHVLIKTANRHHSRSVEQKSQKSQKSLLHIYSKSLPPHKICS